MCRDLRSSSSGRDGPRRGSRRRTTDPASESLNVRSVIPSGVDLRPGAVRLRWWHLALALVAMAATSCGSNLLGPASTSSTAATASGPVSTTAPPIGEVAVAFPVVGCTTPYGTPLPGQPWRPSILLAPIPTALVGQVEFYTDGTHSILAPSSWSCIDITASDGATDLAVDPAGAFNTTTSGAPAPGTEGVFATFDTTGRPSGAAMVCPFFAIPQWQQQEADCNGQKPTGEQSSMPTPDVVSVSDPAGITGTLTGSGGLRAVTGTVIFPQVTPKVSDGASINVAMESCSLTDAALCPTVLSDFDVRQFPVPSASGGSG